MHDTVALQVLYLFFIRGETMNKTVYCAALCIMHYAAYGIFNHIPGDQIWVMVDQIGRTNQAIEGYATPITTENAGPVTINNLPVTITTPGRYAVVEPLSYTPSNATDYPITIDADNVYLTFNGYTLTVGNKTASSIAIMNGRNNISIVNGAINGGDTVFFMGNHDGITLDSLFVNDCGTAATAAFTIAGGSNNITASNIRENGNQNTVGFGLKDCTNIRVSNCAFDNNLSNGLVMNGCQHVTVENVIVNETNLNGIVIGSSSDVYITDCSVAALSAGLAPIAYNIVEDSEHVVLNNCSSAGNGTNSIGLQIRDCTAVSCKGFSSSNDNIGIQQSDTLGFSSLTTIENATIELAATNGILFSDDTTNITLHNVDIIRPGSTAILGTNGSNLVFKNINLIDLNAGNGIQFTAVDNFVLKDSSCIARSGNTVGFIIAIPTISNAVFKNNKFLCNQTLGGGILFETSVLDTCILDSYISNTNRAINCVNSFNMVIANNTINDNHIGIEINGSSVTAIRNCTLDNNTTDGIAITGSLGAITQNNVNFNNILVPSNTGISLSLCSKIYVGFNTIALRGTGPGATAVGITESITSTDNAFLGNMIQNCLTCPAATTTSFFNSVNWHCNPSGGGDPVPASHWENLHIVYSA